MLPADEQLVAEAVGDDQDRAVLGEVVGAPPAGRSPAARSCRRAPSPAPGQRWPPAACSPGRRSRRRRRRRGPRARRGPGYSWRWRPAPRASRPRCIEPEVSSTTPKVRALQLIGRGDPVRAGNVGRGRLAAAGPRIRAHLLDRREVAVEPLGQLHVPGNRRLAQRADLLHQPGGQEAPALRPGGRPAPGSGRGGRTRPGPCPARRPTSRAFVRENIAQPRPAQRRQLAIAAHDRSRCGRRSPPPTRPLASRRSSSRAASRPRPSRPASR